MKRILWFALALLGVVAIGAACDPFGTPEPGDYVVFENCPVASCAAGESNILVMKSPDTTTAGGVTTMTGSLQLRLRGRDGATHGYLFGDGKIVEDLGTPSDSSITAAAPTELEVQQWKDAFGVSGLDLSGISLSGRQNASGVWDVKVSATPTIATGSEAASLLPPLAPGVNTFAAAVSDPNIPLTAGVNVNNLTFGEYHFDSLDLSKTSWPGHSDVHASISGASGSVSGVPISDVNATVDFDNTFHGHLDVTGNVASGATILPVAVDMPVHLDGGNIVAGPGATISVGQAPDDIALSGTFTVGGVMGDGPTSVALTDGVLHYGSTDIPVSATVTDGPEGLTAELHAGSAQLSAGVLLHNVDLTWANGTLAVHGSADLTGNVNAQNLTVDGTATITGGAPSVSLTVSADSLTFGLPAQGSTQRNVALNNVSFHIGGDFTGGNVNFNAALALDHGTVGDTTISGNLNLSGTLALGSSFSLQGWKFDLGTTVNVGAIHANATFHGSGGILYDGTNNAAAEVDAVLDISDNGNGIGGILRANVWMSTSGALHIDATGNAHLTLGSKIVIDGAVQVTDNVIYVNANVQFGTKTAVPVTGTITLNPNNLTAMPSVELSTGRVFLTTKLWIDDVRISNTGSSDLAHFVISGKIETEYGKKALGLISVAKRFGALNIAGTVDLSSANLSNIDTTNIGYDLHITAPDATNSSPLLWLFYANNNDFTFHVWGNSHTANLSLSAEATLFVGLQPLGAGAKIHVAANGSVNLDNGSVNVSGTAGAEAFVNLGIVADGSASATINISLTGSIDSAVNLSVNGSGTFSADALGFLPIASGGGTLTGTASISLADGSISGSAHLAYGVNVVGGLFGNTDGDWYYNLAGSTTQPVVTAHDSYSRHNHTRGINIAGQVYPVKNLCGQKQYKHTIDFNGWSNDGQWGACLGTGYVDGRVLVDTDGSRTNTGADVPLPAGTTVAVSVLDASNGNALVGQGVTDANGNFHAPVVAQPGHTYSVQLGMPNGYVYQPGTLGYVAAGGTSIASPGSGQTSTVGTFGIGQRQYGSLTGVVFTDTNHNGTQDAGEDGMPGVTLTIDGRAAISGPNGRYDVNMLDAGNTVTVNVTAPSGWSVTADPDGVIDGATHITIQPQTTMVVGGFGLCQGASCQRIVRPPLVPIEGIDPNPTLASGTEAPSGNGIGRELTPVS